MKRNWAPFDPAHDPTDEDLDRISAAMAQAAIRRREATQAQCMEQLRQRIVDAAYLDRAHKDQEPTGSQGTDLSLG